MEQPALAYLVDLAVQMGRDVSQDESELRRRDRGVGLRLTGRELGPRGQVMAWLDEVAEPPRQGVRVVGALRLTQLLLGIAGLGLGWGAARALFHYDGTVPVNVVGVLAVFVGLQLLVVAALGLTLLPRGLLRFVPGARSLQDALSLLSPGQLWRFAERFLPQEYRQAAGAALARGAVHRRLFGRVEKWIVVRAAQVFAVAFNVGALAGCLYLVVFSDLAFTWSTTLNLDPNRMHRLTRFIAAPWAWLLPQASPSLHLIEATRYFRFREGLLPPAGPGGPAYPAVLGGWWPFLLAAMAFYGLAVRSILLGLAAWRCRRAVEYALLHTRGVGEVLDRLNSDLVETRAEGGEVARTGPALGTSAPDPFAGSGRQCVVVNWAGVDLSDGAAAQLVTGETGHAVILVTQAGGASDVEDDGRVVAELGAEPVDGPVVILVKAWEPAMLEFVDFVRDLRRALGEGRAVVVMPVGRGADGQVAPPEPRDRSQWQARMGAAGDPWVSVRPVGGGA